MNLRNKKVRLAIGLIVAVGTVAGIICIMPSRVPTQIVTLPDGRQYRFAGVTWGTNHSQPRLIARLTDRLPAAWGDFVRKKYGTRLGLLPPFWTTEPALCVWLQPLNTKTPLAPAGKVFTFELADQNGVMVGTSQTGQSSVGGGGIPADWVWMVTSVFPRRSASLQVVIFDPSMVANGTHQREIGRITFRNQMSGQFPQWQPETIPNVKMVGDVEVRLTNFTTGFDISRVSTYLGNGWFLPLDGQFLYPFRNPLPGEPVVSVFDVMLSPAGGKNRWTIESAELSDATGNHLRADHYQGNIVSYRRTILGALWPDEAAWRLKLELKSGSSGPEDSVVFTNVPVPLTTSNIPPLLTNFHGGIRVVLTQFSRTARGPARSLPNLEIRAELPDHPKGVALEFAFAIAGTGEAMIDKLGESGDEFSDLVSLNSIPTNTTNLNLFFRLQKTRSVEFLVKPPQRNEPAKRQ